MGLHDFFSSIRSLTDFLLSSKLHARQSCADSFIIQSILNILLIRSSLRHQNKMNTLFFSLVLLCIFGSSKSSSVWLDYQQPDFQEYGTDMDRPGFCPRLPEVGLCDYNACTQVDSSLRCSFRTRMDLSANNMAS